MDVIGYHASKARLEDNNIQILKHNWPNDLGKGFYCYIDEKKAINRSLGFDSPKKNAEKYYLSLFHKKKKMKMYEVRCQIKDNRILNLSDPYYLKKYSEFLKRIEKISLDYISEIGKEVSGRTHRGVIDGFFIENFIKVIEKQNKSIQRVEAVIMITATDFSYKIIKNKIKKYRTQIPNGCELCIREKECIKKITKVEVDNNG